MSDATPASILLYIHDPMCSWCYGFSPTWRALKQDLPKNIGVVSLLGGLAPDSTESMPAEMVDYLKRTWQRIESVCGVTFDARYWDQSPPPPRTTFVACRAVVAAETMGGLGERMGEAIQEAYFQQAQSVWRTEVLASLAADLGLDPQAFVAVLESPETRGLHDEQRALVERLQVTAYPTVLLMHQDTAFPIAIRHQAPEVMRAEILELIGAAGLGGALSQ